MKIKDFTVLEGGLKTTLTALGKKQFVTFDPLSMPLSRMKVLYMEGDLTTFTKSEILKATGRHCPHTLVAAIEEALGEKPGTLLYSGKSKISDVYQGKDGTTYCKLSYSVAHGRNYEIKKVPQSFVIGDQKEIDNRITNQWEQMKVSTNGKSKSFKRFKKEVTEQ